METYYHPHDLGKFAEMGKGNKELWEKFMAYYSAVFAEGALTEREKALIALAVAHAVQCPYCIDAYTQASLRKRVEYRRNDGSRPRRLRHPRRRFPRTRRPDAQRCRQTLDVSTSGEYCPQGNGIRRARLAGKARHSE